MRQIFLLFCFITLACLAFVNAPSPVAGANQFIQMAAQVSPLVSPLLTAEKTVTVATATIETATVQTATIQTTTIQTTTIQTATVAAVTTLPVSVPPNGSPISLVLVGAVLLGILAVTGIVIWRRR